MQRTLQSQTKAIISTSPFRVDRSRALGSWEEQGAEHSGSGGESLVPGIPGMPPWPGILHGRLMPSSLLGGGGMRLMMRRASSRLMMMRASSRPLDLSWPMERSELLLDDECSESWSKCSCKV